MARVSCPAAKSWIRQWAPTNPVPPVTKTRAIHSSPMIEAIQPTRAPNDRFLRSFQKRLLSSEEMLHRKPRFKVKDYTADRRALETDEDLDLTHSFLREARRGSEADPEREWLSDVSGLVR